MFKLIYGIDVGSTTAKIAVVDPETKKILWNKYERHETKQPEKVAEMLVEIGQAFPDVKPEEIRCFITGSGGGPIAEHIGAKFVQEVNAVTMAVEELHPDVGSVVELGGQDAKIIIFKENKKTGDKNAITSMNDKCASGTGATIDKCVIKVGMPREEIPLLKFDDSKLHHVAAKCGVFAETDIVNLVKSGIPRDEIMNSLADAIVMQNLSVLTRGNTLRSRVLLLGGPNTYLPFLQECWRLRIPETWEERGYKYDKSLPDRGAGLRPGQRRALRRLRRGALRHARAGRGRHLPRPRPPQEFITHGRKAKLGENAGPPLVEHTEERDAFLDKYRIPKFEDATLSAGPGGPRLHRPRRGLDLVQVRPDRRGRGDPQEVLPAVQGQPDPQDMQEMFTQLRDWAHDQGAEVEVAGFGVTGYAGDVLEAALGADANIVETVAHMMSACHYFDKVDVICDIGGQDIKVLFMQNDDIKNFRLSNSCSAGNGMLLQAMADQFGIPVTEYADTAFKAGLVPEVLLRLRGVPRLGPSQLPEGGLRRRRAARRVWRWCCPRTSGSTWSRSRGWPSSAQHFVLQGGTQYNMAALKAQVDYIEKRVPGAEVYVHPHPGEAGAIGAAFEARRVVNRRGHSTFIGLMRRRSTLTYTTRTDEETRCNFCPNNCSRTFIDTQTSTGGARRSLHLGLLVREGHRRGHGRPQGPQQERKSANEALPQPGRLRGQAVPSRQPSYKPRLRCRRPAASDRRLRSSSERCSAA